MKKTALLILFGVCLTGCSTLTQIADEERTEQVKGIDKHSSYPAIRRDYFEKINLLELIDPEQNASKDKFKPAWDAAVNQEKDNKEVSYGARYDLALAWFRQAERADAQKRQHRNSIQERMLSVSISRCNVFKTFLRRDQANQNFMLGAATTVSGILGAVLQGVNSSRNLAGAAGIFSGIRSEYNQAYYSNLAAHVIVKGIETRQELVYRRIQNEGQSKSIVHYPLEAAIKDAVYFDGLCSVVTGLDQAAASVDATTEPGLDAATRTLLRARLAQHAANMSLEQLVKPETLESIGLAGTRLGMSLVGSARGERVPAEVETDLYVAAAKLVEQVDTAASSVANDVERAARDHRSVLLDKMKSGDKNKDAIEKAKPAEGAIATAVKAVLQKNIIDPLKLASCSATVAKPAMDARGGTIVAREAATTDEARVKADVGIKEAARGIQKAHDLLEQKQKLIKLDLDAYRKDRLAEIEKIINAAELNDLKKLSPDAKPKASKEQGCGS